jgi:imidazolonepropionase-like amidohydrolase
MSPTQYIKSDHKGPHAAPDIDHKTLIKNVSIFDGTTDTLIKGQDVVLKDNTIDKIIPAGSQEDAYGHVIDGKGGYLTPGLIDSHYHCIAGVSLEEILNGPSQFVHCMMVHEMDEMIMRGVTTVRDVGGNTFGLKMAIDKGLLKGPRIYPSGACIGQYSGHTDFRNPNYLPKEWGGPNGVLELPELNFGALANGRQQLVSTVRHQLYLGATQIKIATGGGVSSYTDPLYVNEFVHEEIEAVVRVTEDYGTYVAVHVFNPVGIKRSLKAGCKTIEHGHLIDEEAMELMAEKGAYLATQVYVMTMLKPIYTDPIRKAKLELALTGMDNMFTLAKKYNVTVTFGTDLLFDYEGRKGQLKDLALRKPWYSDAEIMIQATGNCGELVALCGQRNPYGKLGVIEEDAMADVLIYDKNPLKDVSICEDFENNLKLIVKDGKVFKNTL